MTLPDGARGGLLTTGAFLALNARSSTTSPTLRGQFIRERLLCQTVPAPPDNVDTTLPPPAPGKVETMRERLTRHMADPGCAACHRLMDPAGLALEGFDGLGRARDTDGGRPLDLTGALDDQSFDGAQGLARTVRAHPAAASCLIQQLVQQMTGTHDHQAAASLAAQLGAHLEDRRGPADPVPGRLRRRGAVSHRGGRPMTACRRPTLHRRTLLRGGLSGLGVSLALPPLEAMLNRHGTAHADGSALPKRFAIFYWGNGMRPEKWMPTGTGATWTPGDAHQPLLPLKDYLSIATGMEVKYNGSAHHTGRSGILSGTYDRGKGTYGSATLPSADTLVADAWKGKAAFDYLNIGISMRGKGGNGARGTSGSASFDGAFKLRRNEYSPSALYKRIFQNVTPTPPGGQPDDPERARQMLARKSIIDLVSADARALQMRLGASDRTRIDGHLEALRSLERGLNVAVGGGCSTAADRARWIRPSIWARRT